MKTAISLPDPLFRAADRLAKRMGLSRSELFRRALEAFLPEHEEAGVTESLNKVYGLGSEEARIDPLLEQWQLSTIPKDEWC